jgi:hypothetical protein
MAYIKSPFPTLKSKIHHHRRYKVKPAITKKALVSMAKLSSSKDSIPPPPAILTALFLDKGDRVDVNSIYIRRIKTTRVE